MQTASLTDSHRGGSQWSGPTEAGVRVSRRGRGGRELQRGELSRKRQRDMFEKDGETEDESLKMLMELCLLFFSSS